MYAKYKYIILKSWHHIWIYMLVTKNYNYEQANDVKFIAVK
jgi:hypothetical protein